MRIGKLFWACLTVLMLLSLVGCHTAARKPETELLVSAAVSLQDSLREIQAVYEERYPNIRLKFNFGSSGSLRQQIEQGAPVDLFITADGQDMRRLVERQLVDVNAQTSLLTNRLVAVIRTDSHLSIDTADDLLQDHVQRIAIGDPLTVPAGTYAKEALTRLQIWEEIGYKTVYGNNVRQVLAYVETGNVDIGFVYRTDALQSAKVKTALSIDPANHRPIRYMAGMIGHTRHKEAAEAFYDFLTGDLARDIFVSYGFEPSE